MSGYNRNTQAGGFGTSVCRYLVPLAGTAALCAGLLLAVPASAGDSCNCVANGQRVELGKLFCIKTASGKEFLARCERVLNNTSWKRLQDSCPTAQNQTTANSKPLL